MGEEMEKKRFKINFKIIAVLFLVIILAAGTSYVAVRFFFGTANGAGEEEAENSYNQSEIYPVFEQQNFAVKLTDEGRAHYIKTSIVLAMDDAKLAKELQQRAPQIRDTIITILRNKSSSDLNHVQGTQKLKEEIKDEINSYLKDGKIVEIYFTDIVIQ